MQRLMQRLVPRLMQRVMWQRLSLRHGMPYQRMSLQSGAGERTCELRLSWCAEVQREIQKFV